MLRYTMKKVMLKKTHKSEGLLKKVVAIESAIAKMPPLSDLDRAQLENSRAIEHLYYSSKLEGTQLTQKRIDQAIHGKEFPTTKK